MLKKWFLRVLKFSVVGLLVLVLFSWVASEVVIRRCVAPEPAVPKGALILKQKLRREGERVLFGRSWLQKREGIWALYLEGDPFTIGYSNAKLTHRLLRLQEDEFLGTVQEKLSNPLILRMVRTFVAYYNCSLYKHIPKEYRQILLGLSRGAPHNHETLGPSYNKYMNYHAAHDISHLIMDTPFVSASGCTGFAAWGKWTPGGHLMSGRNFDFETARAFDVHKVVSYVKPDKGIPFMAVGWSGFFGVVSGINRVGLSVSLYAGHASGRSGIGTPISFVAREVLQYAKDIKQAVRIICKARVFVSESFLLGSRAERRFVVVEKSPARCAVREPKEQRILVANHFLDRAFSSDLEVSRYKKSGTSLSRYSRMDVLTKRFKGQLGAGRIAEILRDRRGVKDRDIGLGNRASLNALIATHSVIFDLDQSRMWVSAAPHQLGKFVAFDVLNFSTPSPASSVPADPFLKEGFVRYRAFRVGLKQLKEKIKRGFWKAALAQGQKLEKMNPRYYELLGLLGKVCEKIGDVKQAKGYLRRALEVQPAYDAERRQLEARLKRLR